MADEEVIRLVARVEAHCEAAGQSVTAFGRAVMGDPNIIHELRAGRRSPTLKTLRRIEAALAPAADGIAQNPLQAAE